MRIHIVEVKESYRLITDEDGRYAVVEARCGHVYSLHGNQRRMALDSDAGMALVVGKDGWFGEPQARACLEAAARGEDYYRQHIR
jgi:hypothetical protein